MDTYITEVKTAKRKRTNVALHGDTTHADKILAPPTDTSEVYTPLPFETHEPQIPSDEMFQTFVSQAQNIGDISDGLDYAMPTVLSQTMREHLEAQGQLETYLKESAAQSFRFQFDTPQRGASDMPIAPTTEDPLREWDYSTRRMVLEQCNSVYHRNPLANTAVQYTADFVIGDGFNLQCKNYEVEEFLQEFIEHADNCIREYERQALIDLQKDGELFLRIFEEQGRVAAVPLRAWECEGIKTEKGFFRRKEFYRFQFHQSEGDVAGNQQSTEQEDVDADEIIHVAINRSAYELRGRPDLYRILAWLRADREFLENRARQNHWRNALLWLVQVAAGGNPNALAQVSAKFRKPPEPGTVVTVTDKVNVTPLSNPVGAGDAAEDGRQIKLRNIMGMRLPEYFFADGYNANLATAKSQQLPAITKFSAYQRIMIEQLWKPLFKRVLQVAVDAGLLPEEVEECDAEGDVVLDEETGAPKMCLTVECFDVSYSPVFEGTLAEVVNAVLQAKDGGILNLDRAIEIIGENPVIVRKNMEKDMEQELADMAQGRRPIPPNMLGMTDKDGNPVANTDEEGNPIAPNPANMLGKAEDGEETDEEVEDSQSDEEADKDNKKRQPKKAIAQ